MVDFVIWPAWFLPVSFSATHTHTQSMMLKMWLRMFNKTILKGPVQQISLASGTVGFAQWFQQYSLRPGVIVSFHFFLFLLFILLSWPLYTLPFPWFFSVIVSLLSRSSKSFHQHFHDLPPKYPLYNHWVICSFSPRVNFSVFFLTRDITKILDLSLK